MLQSPKRVVCVWPRNRRLRLSYLPALHRVRHSRAPGWVERLGNLPQGSSLTGSPQQASSSLNLQYYSSKERTHETVQQEEQTYLGYLKTLPLTWPSKKSFPAIYPKIVTNLNKQHPHEKLLAMDKGIIYIRTRGAAPILQ